MTNSKNKRKFRVWDNTALTQGYEQATQIATKIEEKLAEGKVDVYDLPVSMIPTHILYNFVLMYEEMYNKLVDEHLLQAGYPKTDSSKTH